MKTLVVILIKQRLNLVHVCRKLLDLLLNFQTRVLFLKILHGNRNLNKDIWTLIQTVLETRTIILATV